MPAPSANVVNVNTVSEAAVLVPPPIVKKFVPAVDPIDPGVFADAVANVIPFGPVPSDDPDIFNNAPTFVAVIPDNTLFALISVANALAINVAVAPLAKKFVNPSLASVFGFACAIKLTVLEPCTILNVSPSFTSVNVNEPDEKVSPVVTAVVTFDDAGVYDPASILTTVNVSAYFKYSCAA